MSNVGDIVDSKCGKCKDVRRHTVVALVDGEIAKVQCNTCQGTHKYRPEGGTKTATKKKAAAKPRKATTKKAKQAEALVKEWEKHFGDSAPDAGKPYSMKETFEVGDSVNHPKFGLGLVQKIVAANKMDVHFREGVKMLVHGME